MILRIYIVTVFIFLATQILNAEKHQGAEAEMNFDTAVKFVENKNYREAFPIFLTLAEQDFPAAQYNLSVLYFNGLGVPKNFKWSLYWAWQANLNNHEKAGNWLDTVISNINEDLRNNVAQTISDEFTQAANEGELAAPLKLGRTYLKLFVQPNNQMAYVWLSIAQAYGYEEASTYLDEATSQLTLEEILIEQENAHKSFQEITSEKN